MRIAFITIHIGPNFGSNLQAIATFEIFRKLGAESICVNYIPPRVTWSRYWKTACQSPKYLLHHILTFPLELMKRHRFQNFQNKHCKVSKAIYHNDDFSAVCPKADVYVTGSDQVWNTSHNEGLDTHYFFVGIKGPKIAFASSIGKSNPSDEDIEWLNEYTKEYKSVSVREESAVKVFEKIGRKAIHVLDPTLMLNKEQWFHYASERQIKEPYLFVYLPYNIADKNLCYESAKKIASLKNLKIISYSHDYYKEGLAEYTKLFAGPEDVLSLIYHADYIVTNSFHGTAFSINLNKQFCVYMPSSFSTRISSLMNLCGLQNFILDRVISEDLLNRYIDYTMINKLLDCEREKTLSYLRDAINI